MAIAVVQSRGTFSAASSATLALAFTNPVVAGNTLAYFLGWNSTTATASASDSVNGAGTLAASSLATGTGGFVARAQIIYRAITASGTPTVTATISTSVPYRILHIVELSGVDTANPLDAAGAGAGSSTAPSASLTTVTANTLLFGGTYVEQTGSAGGGFTGLQNTDGNQSEYKLQAATGATSVAFVQSPTGRWAATAAAFKAATGGGGVTVEQLAAMGVG